MSYPPLGLEAMQAIARSRNGRCLSQKYKNARTPLLWECALGHRWWARPWSVKGNRFRKGSWCRECYLLSLRGRGWPEPLGLADMRAIAESRGGRCLSKTYDRAGLRWECGKGHQWDSRPENVKSGTWCPYCAGTMKRDLAEMRRIAARRGGRCLSEEYVNAFTHLEWECSEGHRWLAQPSAVKGTRNKRGSWCPVCSDTTLGLERMKRLAREKGGRCLSRRYRNNRAPLEWRCKRGHRWRAPAATAQRSWCRKCFVEARKLSIASLREIARRRGGRCLSKEYVNNKAPLRWRCARGHEWRQKAELVKRGSWCARCKSEEKLRELRALASKRGGECLSKKYVMNKVKLRFRCARGHEWWGRPDMVRTAGHWCPACAGKKTSRAPLRGRTPSTRRRSGSRR